MDLIKEREIKGIYKDHDNQKLQGAHYTPSNLAYFVAERIIANYSGEKLNSECSIFDPAVGDGELLFALAQLLISKGVKKVSIDGFDIDSYALEKARFRLSALGAKVSIDLSCQDFTRVKPEKKLKRFDFIIANPPYVRTQSLGVADSAKLSTEYMLEGRVDLYYAFLLGISKFMHEKSVCGFIVSNRFMSTKSGASVRKGLLNTYNIHDVWDFGDTKLFEAAVLPAVLVFSAKKKNIIKTKFSAIYSCKPVKNQKNIDNVFSALKMGSGIYSLPTGITYEVKSGDLKLTEDVTEVWRISNKESDNWMDQVENYKLKTFGDIGKIRVGVKTTADKVFIRKDWSDIEPNQMPESEVMKPLITHHFARRFKSQEGNSRQILYPHISENGIKKTVNIDLYPKAKKYLNQYKEQLESRDYLIKAGRQWFELWVPHEPHLWSFPKIVFRDICEKPTFWMDTTGSIVNGDCYWITVADLNAIDELWIALAVANSTFIEEFYDRKFNNKLYSGRRRFMTQYVQQFPIPKLSLENKNTIIELTKKIFNTFPNDISVLEKSLDSLVWKAFGFNR